MALPTLDATFASSADLPRKQMLAKWLVNLQYSGSIEDYYTLPEKYLYAKIAVAAGASRSEADYISLPDRYVWSDIYKAVSGSSADTIDRGEKEALGWIAAAVRGDAADLAKVATYISWPWRYQVASIITSLAVDADAQSFVTTSGATDIEGIDQFVKGVKNLGLWDSMVCWPMRSTQNAGTGTTAYSLGGLGTFNGTLINGAAWGTNGIVFDGINDYISMQISPKEIVNFPFTLLSSYYPVKQGAWQGLFSVRSLNFNTSPTMLLSIDSPPKLWASSIGGGFDGNLETGQHINVWKFGACRFSNGSSQVTVDGNQFSESSAAATALSNTTQAYIGRHVNAEYFGGTSSICIYIAATGVEQSIRSLYKSTLGTGLGLP